MPNRPNPTLSTKPVIHAFAENLAMKLGFGPGDPIEPLVKRLGGRVVIRDSAGEEYPESIHVRSSTNFTIFVPGMTSLERDRFTIAHEIGHLVLHFPLVRKIDPTAEMVATRWVDESDKQQQRAEWEANWFAAAFLMGSHDFRVLHGELRGNMPLLALKFGVSQKAAEIRAKTLNLI